MLSSAFLAAFVAFAELVLGDYFATVRPYPLLAALQFKRHRRVEPPTAAVCHEQGGSCGKAVPYDRMPDYSVTTHDCRNAKLQETVATLAASNPGGFKLSSLSMSDPQPKPQQLFFNRSKTGRDRIQGGAHLFIGLFGGHSRSEKMGTEGMDAGAIAACAKLQTYCFYKVAAISLSVAVLSCQARGGHSPNPLCVAPRSFWKAPWPRPARAQTTTHFVPVCDPCPRPAVDC